jgi:sterol desaturase/sphingolipid hydroxylase (fatty acid hydroxylase superfamily)
MESSAYWVVFVATFLGFAVWESLRPKHDPGPTERRWYKHGILLVICTVILVGVYRISPVVLAANVTGSRFGLLNKPWIPFAVRCILAVLVLDLVKYAIHRLSHAVRSCGGFTKSIIPTRSSTFPPDFGYIPSR